jgi:hypothetical protein
MKYIIKLSLLLVCGSLHGQAVLAEVESAITVDFQEILLVSVSAPASTHQSPPPLEAGLGTVWPQQNPTFSLRFTCTPAVQNRIVEVGATHPWPVQLQIQGASVPTIPGTQLFTNFPLTPSSTPAQIIEISKGGCTGNGPSDGVFMELVGNLTALNYALLRSGNHQINLTWNVF